MTESIILDYTGRPMIKESIDFLNDPHYWGFGNNVLGRKTVSGENVTAESALALDAYYACLRNISEDIGKLPLVTYKRKELPERGKDKQFKHPVYKLLHDSPNPEMNSNSFRETLNHHAMGWGGGYAEIERNGAGTPVALWPIHPRRVEIKREGGVIVYKVRGDTMETMGDVVTIPQRNMLHIHGLGGDGLAGYILSVLASESIGYGKSVQKYGASFFGNDARPGGVLEHPGELKGDARTNLLNSWRQQHTRPEFAHLPEVLEEGMQWKSIDIPPDQAQFLQTQQHTVETVARWFRMPPHKIGHLLRSTFNNIDSQSIEYVTDTLMPWTVRWEQEIKRKLFVGEDDIFAEFVLQALLRGDPKKRSEYYKKQFAVGSLSSNDINELENRNGIGPLGDQYFVPSNMQPLEAAAKVGQGTEEEPSQTNDKLDNKLDDVEIVNKIDTKRICESFKPLFIDAFTRVITKESKAIIKASARYKDSVDDFETWLSEFMGTQGLYMSAVTKPLFDSMFVMIAGHTTVIEFNIIKETESRERYYLSSYYNQEKSNIKFSCDLMMTVEPKRLTKKIIDQIRSN